MWIIPHTRSLAATMRHPLFVSALLAALSHGVSWGQESSKLELKQGDHIAIVGNALADRMQHTGSLETLIQGSQANKQLVFRNLAAAADEVDTWHRSQEFGS